MRNIILVSIAAAAVAGANPVVMTFVNEFGFDGEGRGWVELHAEPAGELAEMSGWLLVTSTSVCTFDYVLPAGDFLVVDSGSLAGGSYGRGTFRLNPVGDSIVVVPDPGHMYFGDGVRFPVLPAGQGQSPTPPLGGSASVCNDPQAWWQTINWYIDSTPTPQQDNDDYSSVSGAVTWSPGRGFQEVDVVVSGPMGTSGGVLASSGQTYLAIGLGAGKYSVAAIGYPGSVRVVYPESIDLGFSQTLQGIDLDFDPPGVEESGQQTAYSSQLSATVIRGVLTLSPATSLKPQASSLLDASGRKVMDLRSGANDVSRLPAGVYFVREAQAQAQAQVVHKVVIQR